MGKVWSYASVLFILFCHLTALAPEKCQEKPKEKHCLIEWSVRDRWPHQIRYVFDWATGSCFEIRWSNHCSQLPPKPGVNNWAALYDCYSECTGWA